MRQASLPRSPRARARPRASSTSHKYKVSCCVKERIWGWIGRAMRDSRRAALLRRVRALPDAVVDGVGQAHRNGFAIACRGSEAILARDVERVVIQTCKAGALEDRKNTSELQSR